MGRLTTAQGRFLLDGQDFHLISGAIHYFRVPREYWRDRLEKLRALGCNAVETYLPWNLHEPRPGQFDFSGDLDVEAFLRLAQELGLHALVRPSPYTCGEFEFGGLPWWLLKEPNLRVRSVDPRFLAAVRRYYAEVLPRLAALQAGRGGPILAFQIENEYGYYGNDQDYLGFLRKAMVDGGLEELLFTTDGPWGEALEAGSIPGVLAGGSFGSGAPEHFRKMKALRPQDPLFCSEFWMGWFDAWGEEHHIRDAQDAARSLDEILSEGHVNLYMFHGGTNFGFTSGANHYEELKPDVTSYDYDAPLSESGQLTPKYHAFREVIARRSRDPEGRRRAQEPLDEKSWSTRIQAKALGSWPVKASVSLDRTLGALSRPHRAERPFTMEELDQAYGYIFYRIPLEGPRTIDPFRVWKCHDRVTVYVNDLPVFSQTGNQVGAPVKLELAAGPQRIDLLVENQGRVNFGEKMNDQHKGIGGAIIVDKHGHSPVETWPLPLDNPGAVDWSSGYLPGTAGFHRIAFEVPEAPGVFTDTFLSLPGWGKGVAWVNGRNLGRFWELGPQETLYVPGPYLRPGTNELVVFESEGKVGTSVELVAEPRLGTTRKT